jgi:AsmA protein
MTRSPRFVFVAAAVALVILAVATAVGVRYLVDANAYKPRLEAAVSKTLGMELTVGGPMDFGVFPGLLVTLADVRVRNRGSDVVSAGQARLGIELLPLLSGEVRITSLALDRATISVTRDRDGHFNFEPAQAASAGLPALDWPGVSLTDASFVYTDARMAHPIEADACKVAMQGLRLTGGRQTTLMRDVSFTADVSCGALRRGPARLTDLTFAAAAQGGVLQLTPVTLLALDAKGAWRIRADYSAAAPRYALEGTISQLPIEELFKALALKQTAVGRVDVSATLSLQGKTEKELRQSLAGRVTLKGRDVTLNGSDLDQAFARFEATQSFNLVDAGAFFIVGPLGLVLTKGYDFANVYQGGGGSSQIRTLVSDWKLDGGVARAQDVAMATQANRIALQGRLDFVNERFDDVTMALVDAKGCVKVEQKVSGSFAKPVVEKPNLLVSLAGPALNLLKKGGELLLGQECKVFYAGSVASPP